MLHNRISIIENIRHDAQVGSSRRSVRQHDVAKVCLYGLTRMLTRQCMLLVLNELVYADRWAYKHHIETINSGRERHEGLLASEPRAGRMASPCLCRYNADDISIGFFRIQHQHNLLVRGTAD
jgi:hypothetical protein